MDVASARWWQRPAAPGPLRPALAVLAMAMLPAVAGAVLDWSLWLILVALLPALVGMLVLGQMGGRARGWASPPPPPSGPQAAIITSVVLFGIWAASFPDRYVGLMLVGLGVIVDQLERAQWRRAEARR